MIQAGILIRSINQSSHFTQWYFPSCSILSILIIHAFIEYFFPFTASGGWSESQMTARTPKSVQIHKNLAYLAPFLTVKIPASLGGLFSLVSHTDFVTHHQITREHGFDDARLPDSICKWLQASNCTLSIFQNHPPCTRIFCTTPLSLQPLKKIIFVNQFCNRANKIDVTLSQ